MSGCIRCSNTDTNGYPDVYCRECVEEVAWILKRARDRK